MTNYNRAKTNKIPLISAAILAAGIFLSACTHTTNSPALDCDAVLEGVQPDEPGFLAVRGGVHAKQWALCLEGK